MLSADNVRHKEYLSDEFDLFLKMITVHSICLIVYYLTCYFTVVYSDICLLITEIQTHDVSGSHNSHL